MNFAIPIDIFLKIGSEDAYRKTAITDVCRSAALLSLSMNARFSVKAFSFRTGEDGLLNVANMDDISTDDIILNPYIGNFQYPECFHK